MIKKNCKKIIKFVIFNIASKKNSSLHFVWKRGQVHDRSFKNSPQKDSK